MAALMQRGDTWYVAWRDGNRQRRQTLRTTSKVEAKRRLAIWERRRAQDEWRDKPADCAPGAFWERYEGWMRMHLAPSTIQNRVLHWRKFLDLFKPPKMGSATRAQVERVKEKLVTEGMNPVSVNNFVKDLRAVYNTARTEHLGDFGPMYTGSNPFERIKRVEKREGDKEKQALMPEQVEALIQAAAEHSKAQQADNIHLVFALGGYAGLRKNEIVNARWEWIDWDAKTISVVQNVTFRTKNRRSRTIPLASKLAAILEPYRHPEGYIYMDNHTPGKRYRCNFQRSFQFVCNKAGLAWVTPHVLRHSWITNLLKASVPIAKVSQWAGHHSIMVTADIYGHLQTYDSDIDRL